MNNSTLYNGAFDVFEKYIARSFPIMPPSTKNIHELYSNYFIVDSPKFNASVSIGGNNTPKYYFNLGVALGVFDSVSTLAGITDFYKEIPIELPTWMNESIGRLRNRCTDYRFLFEGGKFKGWVAGVSFIPDNPDEIESSIRGRLGNFLIELCFKFISYHEQAHFELGHLNIVSKELGVNRLHEASSEHDDCSIFGDPKLARYFELEADAGAITKFFETMPGTGKSIDLGITFPDAYQPTVWARCVIYAATIVMIILTLSDAKFFPSEKDRKHPYIFTRLISVMNTIEYELQKIIKSRKKRDEFYSSIIEDINVIYTVFGLNMIGVADSRLKYDGFKISNGEVFEEELQSLRSIGESYKK